MLVPHGKSKEICEWVIKNYENRHGNSTIDLWVRESKEQLEFLSKGGESGSTDTVKITGETGEQATVTARKQ